MDNESIIKMFEFEKKQVTTVTYKGKIAFIAREIGQLLEYSDEGNLLSTYINGQWRDSFQEGKHFTVVTGQDLADLKQLLRLTSKSGVSRAPHLMILFESGVYQVALRSNKPAALRFHDFLINHVFPQLVRDGKYSPDCEVVMPNDKNQIVRVGFHGGEIEAVKQGDDIWVSIRRACEHLGIDHKAQQDKLREKEWARGVLIPLPDARGHNQEAFMLHLDSVPMWLATIDASRVSMEAKPLLILYQKEAARVLRDHFYGRAIQTPKTLPDALRLAADLAEANEKLEEQKTRLLAEKAAADTRIKKFTPLAEFASAIIESDGALHVGDFAKSIRINGRVIGRDNLFKWLHAKGFLYSQGERKNIPFQTHVDAGRFRMKISYWLEKDGTKVERLTPLITTRGQFYIVNRLLDDELFLKLSKLVDNTPKNCKPELIPVCETKVAEVTTGEKLPALPPVISISSWKTSKQIAERFGVTTHRVERASSAIWGKFRKTRDGILRIRIDKESHSAAWIYSPRAIAMIENHLRGEGIGLPVGLTKA